MKLFSTHNHSTGSDGRLTPEQVVKKAIELKWSYVYFTDHYFSPLNYPTNYNRKHFPANYIDEVKKLQEKYGGIIDIYLGVEMDWYEKNTDWFKSELKKQDYDYVIGSIHVVSTEKIGVPGGRDIESGIDYWKKTAEMFGSVQEYVTEYYNQIKKLVKSGLYNCVGHLDYIKVYNEKYKLFDEHADWYKKVIGEALDVIKKSRMVLEINIGGVRKCNSPFPSPWIIKQANKRGIPITLGLDGHWEEHYDNKELRRAIKLAHDAGYKKQARFVKQKMIMEDL
ncbi:histidinol-phosphatase [Candidatus Pacearchaeota archaeon]|nr:histidinol-phosphatase [Candidatus Pacearchaeota archaeon]